MNPIPLYSTFEVAFPVSASLAICTYGEIDNETISVDSYIERFHRSLKEEEVWVSQYQSLEEARSSIGRYLWEYNHDRPHRGLRDRTPREAFVSFESDLRIEALGV